MVPNYIRKEFQVLPTSGIFSTSPEDPDRHPSWTPASAQSSLGECVAIVFTCWEDDSRFSFNCNGPRFPMISWSVCCSFIFFIFHDPSRLYNKERCWNLASCIQYDNGHKWTSFESKGCPFHLNRKATESNLVCKIWTTTTWVPYHIFISYKWLIDCTDMLDSATAPKRSLGGP